MRVPVHVGGGPVPDLPLSPAIRSGGHLFPTGMTGSGADGSMPEDPRAQFDAIFGKIEMVLGAAGASLDAVVEMARHFETFESVLRRRLATPYPAWTAVEVAGLRRGGALVEVRVIAQA